MTGQSASQFHVAIVGSGPSGFYAAEALLRAREDIHVDIYDRLPTPFGLVRGGVAPDHPNIKKVIAVYDRIARNPRLEFVGNVTVGEDISVKDLRQAYNAVIFANGASSEKRLGVPGDDLPGSHSATEFVGWYNGHPDFTDCTFDLSQEVAAVIGQGNVAADIARILLTPARCLERTDIADNALEALHASKVRHVYVIGRRGPAQAKFTAKELMELGEIEECQAWTDPRFLELNAQSREELADSKYRNEAKNVDLFTAFSRNDPAAAARCCEFRFLESPVSVSGADRVEGLVLCRNRLTGAAFAQKAEATGETYDLACGLVFASIGYRGIPIPGLEFDSRANVLPNDKGRVLEAGRPVPGVYAAGWIKRGATGLIGNNKADSAETVHCLLEDESALRAAERPGGDGIRRQLRERGVRTVSYEDWRVIDAEEIRRGASRDKERCKFVRIPEMLNLLPKS